MSARLVLGATIAPDAPRRPRARARRSRAARQLASAMAALRPVERASVTPLEVKRAFSGG
jgi:hypothetical protein